MSPLFCSAILTASSAVMPLPAAPVLSSVLDVAAAGGVLAGFAALAAAGVGTDDRTVRAARTTRTAGRIGVRSPWGTCGHGATPRAGTVTREMTTGFPPGVTRRG